MFRRNRSGRGRARRARSAHPSRLFRRKPLFELLEDRRLLAVNVFTDMVTGNVTIMDDTTEFAASNRVQEDNDVTLSNGVATPGRLRITDPGGVILDPADAGIGTQINPTTVEIAATATVRIDLQDGDDRLTFADSFASVNTVTVVDVHGGGPANNDGLVLRATAGAAETVTVTVDSNDQAAQVISGYAGKGINVRGFESILYDGAEGDDNLTVDLGFGEATARVQNASPADTDEVVSNTLPKVLFEGINSFTLRGDPGEATTATFVIDSLAAATTYLFASQHDDTLVIEGNGGADAITASLNAGNLRVVASGNTIDTTGMNAADLLQVITLGGDDSLVVNIEGTAPILTPIEFDGGSGADVLLVQGAPTTAVANLIYAPGIQPDEGRLEYRDGGGARLMSIDFDNLEPVIDTVMANTLTVNADGSNNFITVVQDLVAATRGLVFVDGFETVSFNRKTNLVVNALGGDDTVVVNIAAAAVITDLATVRINANDGNDEVRLESLPTAAGFTSARVDGGGGNDIIDASLIPITVTKPLTLNGDAGNDTITGGPGVDTISGGTGDDTFVDSPAADIYNGNGGNDTLVIRGTIINDILSAVQNAPSAVAGTNYTVNIINGPLATPPAAAVDQIVPTTGAAPSDPANRPSIERIVIEALAGDDAITVAHSDAYSDLNGANGIAAQTIPIHVVGDSPNASDRLVVQDNGIGDLVIHREGPDGRSGSIVVGGMAPVTYESTERVDIIPLDDAGQTGTPPGGRLIVFKYDDFETNESATNATPLGLEPVFIGQRNIDPGGVNLPPFGAIPGDEDWYEFRPTVASTFRFDIFFEHIGTLPSGRPGLPGNGDLRLDVFRADGTLIASSDTSAATPLNVDTIESVTIALNPAITQSVFIRVQGATAPLASSPAINNYDIAATDVDDEGPVVFDPDNGGDLQAIFPNNLTDVNLFVPKPDNLLAGATPPIFSLTVNIRDLPVPPAPGDPLPALDTESASQPGVYRLVGDHVGIIDIASVDVLNNFQVAGTVDAAPAPTPLTFRDAGLVGQNLPPLTGQQTLVGAQIQFTSGANSGQIRTITAYDPATGQITVGLALPVAPAAGDTFTITSANHAQVRLNFREPLPDDRFTLTLLDSITDAAGNRLDGESDAVEPGQPTFPSGNGMPGGNFQARFTVDTRPEIGAAVAQDIDIDINGNYVWDPANGQIGNDTTNIDLSFTMNRQLGANGPLTTGGFNVNDLVFAGRFTNGGAGLPNRLFDQLGVYGYAADIAVPSQRWLIDTNGDGIVTTGVDIFTIQSSLGAVFNVAGAIPIAGNFDGNSANGDEIGLYNAGKWGLDGFNGGVRNFMIEANEVFTGTITGTPFVGNFDGDGLDDLATFNNNTFFFDFRANGFGGTDATFVWGFPGVLDKPVAADIDQDGIDDVGLWVPRNSSSLPREVSEWYFLVSDAVTAPVTDRPELVADNATTTSFFSSNLIGDDSATIQGKLIRFLSGANVGQVRTVTAFNSATGLVTFGIALPTAPLDGDIVSIGGTTNTLELLNHAFSPTPFGFDVHAEFGDELALPVVGNFDPPAAPTYIAPNTGIPGDYDNSGTVDKADYNAWKASYGTSNMTADGNGDGRVDAGDYVVWRNAMSAAPSPQVTATLRGDDNGSTQVDTADDGTNQMASDGAGVGPIDAGDYVAGSDPLDSSFGGSAGLVTLATVDADTSSETTPSSATSANLVQWASMSASEPASADIRPSTTAPQADEDSLLLLVADGSIARIDSALEEFGDDLLLDDEWSDGEPTDSAEPALAVAWESWDNL